MAKFRKGDVLAVTATDHNGDNLGDGTRITFIGVFIGREVWDHRRFLKLAVVFYPEGKGFIGIGRATNVIEREIVSIQNMGRARL